MNRHSIPEELLKKYAAVYVRQSDEIQLVNNPGSTAWQMAQKKIAIEFGWAPELIMVFADLGKSAKVTGTRPEFTRMIELINEGEIGMVFIVDGTRLSRNHTDWAILMDCAAENSTWICCNRQVSNPNNAVGAIKLNMQRTIAVSSGMALRRVLRESRLQKNKLGEGVTRLPPGYIYQDKKIIFTEDKDTAERIRHIFSRFDALGTASAVAREFREQKLEVPVTPMYAGNSTEWREANVARITSILKNPKYAGTFVFGRSQNVRANRTGSDRAIRYVRANVPMEQWHVCLKKSFPAYVSWEQYIKNTRRLTSNKIGANSTWINRGAALLQKIVKCGICGATMTVFYTRKNEVSYRCQQAKVNHGGRMCQSIMGQPVERAVFQAALQTLSDSQFLQVVSVRARQLAEAEDVDPAQQQELNRLKRAALMAKADYLGARRDKLDKRLLTDLEQDWLDLHKRFESFKRDLLMQDKRPLLKVIHADMCSTLADDFEKIWHNSGIKTEFRAAMLRTIVKSVQLTKNFESQKIFITINWHSGAFSTLTLDDTQYRFENRSIAQSTIDLIISLASHHNVHEIAARLSIIGLKTKDGRLFTVSSVRHILRHRKVKAIRKQIGITGTSPEHVYTQIALARIFVVNSWQIITWWHEGIIQGAKGARHEKVAEYLVPPALLNTIKQYCSDLQRTQLTEEEHRTLKGEKISERDWQELSSYVSMDDSDKEIVERFLWAFKYKKPLVLAMSLNLNMDTVFKRLKILKQSRKLQKTIDQLESTGALPNIHNISDTKQIRLSNTMFCISLKTHLALQ